MIGADDVADFVVDLHRSRLAVVLHVAHIAAEKDLTLLFAIGERPEFVAHPPLTDHLAGDHRRPLDVVAGTGGDGAEHQFLGNPAAEERADADMQAVAGLVVLLLFGQIHGHPHGPTAGNDRNLMHRVGTRDIHGDQNMSGLMVGGDLFLLLGNDHRAPFGPHHHLVLGGLQIVHVDLVLVGTGRQQRGLIDQVGQVGTGETRRPLGQNLHVDIGA